MKKFAVSRMAGLLLLGAAGASWAGGPDAQLLEKGKVLFSTDAVPACAICHTLQDAGAEGTIGPDLDELKPDADRIRKVLAEGMGAMPSFAETLKPDEIDAIVAYVVNATGGGQ
ncbi:cytochrome c [Pusillimonas sp. MFBS29]|uniref:SorU family sulfite dehydrogenase c-type cytochrome subunit n=1 Tax=Pusillimonas sp. MFBS29 TaxID=2886690 RepID=UPI001D117514|nr:cytochrome c [Pusillimonas sp. MFBS29]MCC2594881.1 cytochrome c [Pusillimonas sp. MFBS29]